MTTWILRLAKSKTVLFNILSLAVLILASPQLAALGIDPKIVGEAQAIINLLLRFVTVEPLSAKA